MSSGGFTAAHHLRGRGSSAQGSQVYARPTIARQLRDWEKPIQNTGKEGLKVENKERKHPKLNSDSKDPSPMPYQFIQVF